MARLVTAELARKIGDCVEAELSRYKYAERHDNVTGAIVSLVRKPWTTMRRLFGGHGIVATVIVPRTVRNEQGLKEFFADLRAKIEDKFVGFAAYKSSHSFIVLVCHHDLYHLCATIAPELKNSTDLQRNIIQGIVVVDAETGKVSGDASQPDQHKHVYDAVLSALRKSPPSGARQR